MATKILRKGDGFSGRSPELRDEVKKLQKALVAKGYHVDTDGLFGKGTDAALKKFQLAYHLSVDGLAGPETLQALEEATDDSAEPADIPYGFFGDLDWVHAREGYLGKAYWPGGESGVTLDPGVDVGYTSFEVIEKLYGRHLRPEEYASVKVVIDLKGESAKLALESSVVLREIRITKEVAGAVFPYAAEPYWQKISDRFPGIKDADTPGTVQTVMLSLAYNRGPYNKGLNVLKIPIERKNWGEVATLIGNMQQDHSLSGIRKRRRLEANLILSSI